VSIWAGLSKAGLDHLVVFAAFGVFGLIGACFWNSLILPVFCWIGIEIYDSYKVGNKLTIQFHNGLTIKVIVMDIAIGPSCLIRLDPVTGKLPDGELRTIDISNNKIIDALYYEKNIIPDYPMLQDILERYEKEMYIKENFVDVPSPPSNPSQMINGYVSKLTNVGVYDSHAQNTSGMASHTFESKYNHTSDDRVDSQNGTQDFYDYYFNYNRNKYAEFLEIKSE
jgi:hypothetical protein